MPIVIEENFTLTLTEFSRAGACSVEQVTTLVHEGVIEPEGSEPHEWRFDSVSLRRLRVAQRLMRDLEINAAGAALALDLLDEIEQLKSRLRLLPEFSTTRSGV